MLFSGRSNAENRTDVVSVRLQTFYVEQCNNITVMLNTGNLIKSNRVASSKQGCISCGMCSYPELTKDHMLTSAYVNIFRTVTRNAVNKSV